MNTDQFTEFLKQQQSQQEQITKLLQLLMEQQISKPNPNHTDADDSNSNVSTTSTGTSFHNIIKKIKSEIFNTTTMSAENFIEYFEAKCTIWKAKNESVKKRFTY